MNPAPEISTPQVSVVLVSFHSIAPLRRALAALEASDVRAQMEILVVDGGSSDGSAAIDGEFPEVTVMRLPRYFGATKLRNIGTRTAKGEYVLFLSPAIQVRPDTVRLLVEAIEATAAGAVSPLLVDEAGHPAPQLLPLPTPANIGEAAGGKLALTAAAAGEGTLEVDNPSFDALLTRRQTVAGMNYLDERFGEYWGDVDLCYKLRRAGKKLLLVREARAVQNDAGMWQPGKSVAAALAADRAVGAAQFAGKHFSGLMGGTLRASTLFGALAGGRLSAFTRILSGQKIDGTEVIS